MFPIDWPEPFGLVMAEAMACGTPVVARTNGAAPEVIVDGVTGFLADTHEALVQACKSVHALERSACRRSVHRPAREWGVAARPRLHGTPTAITGKKKPSLLLSAACSRRAPWRTVPSCLIVCLWSCSVAAAGADCERPVRWSDLQPTLGIRIDNDALTGDDEDRGYTNGLQVTLRTGNLQGFAEPDCLPGSVRAVDRVVDALHDGELRQKNVLFSVFHGVYTPAEHQATTVVANDRPYAAVLLVGAGYNARRSDSTMHSTQLRFGIVGPSAMGKQLQNGVHKIIGVNEYLHRDWVCEHGDLHVLPDAVGISRGL